MPHLSLRYSHSFEEYIQNRVEVLELLRAAPSDVEQLRSSKNRRLANAIYRSCVMLLSSHLERYCEALVVEGLDAIRVANLRGSHLPPSLRFALVKQSVRATYEIEDPIKQLDHLKNFVTDYAWCWDYSLPFAKLEGNDLISSFDNPFSSRIRSLFAAFGSRDIVGPAIGQYGSTDRSIIESKVWELVDKRNRIAHTGGTVQAASGDVLMYLRCSRRLVHGIDRIFGQEIEKIIGSWPWQQP